MSHTGTQSKSIPVLLEQDILVQCLPPREIFVTLFSQVNSEQIGICMMI